MPITILRSIPVAHIIRDQCEPVADFFIQFTRPLLLHSCRTCADMPYNLPPFFRIPIVEIMTTTWQPVGASDKRPHPFAKCPVSSLKEMTHVAKQGAVRATYREIWRLAS